MCDLHKREIDFLRLLLEEDEYKAISYYSSRLGVSTKTLQADLKRIRKYLSNYHIIIAAQSGKGILLDQHAKNNKQILKDLYQNNIETENQELAMESSEMRRELILKNMLIHSNEKTSIQKLSEKYYVAKTSISNDMKYIENWLKKFDLHLNRSKEGTYIEGSETNIRKAIASHALHENTVNGLLQLFEREDIDFIENILSEIEESTMKIGDIYYVNLLTHILICIKRVKENIHIEADLQKQTINADCLERYNQAKIIADKINEHYQIKIGEEETYYIYKYLISSGFEKRNDCEMKSPVLQDKSSILAKDLTSYLSNYLEVDFEQEQDLMDGLVMHIRPMLNRLEYNIQINNPLLNEMRNRYPEMINICEKALKELSQKHHLQTVSTDEIVNIATYYQTMLERIAMQKKIIVVCHSGYGTSQLLAAKLKNEFAFFTIVDIVSARKIEELDLSGIDFIISTVSINISEIPYIVISSLLTKQDIKDIRNILLKMGS